MSNNSQKEYLKKYLSIGKDRSEKKKKKKKIKPNTIASRLTVIDDNADTFQNAVKDDLLEDEDAPQIVAVIDERPPSLQVDEKSKTNLWIPIGSTTEATADNIQTTIKNGDLSPPRFKLKLAPKRTENADILPSRKSSSNKHTPDRNDEMVKEIKIERDISPPRRRKESSPPRSRKRKDSVEDISPPRPKIVKKSEDFSDSVVRKNEDIGDLSPPRPRASRKYEDRHSGSPPRSKNSFSKYSASKNDHEVRVKIERDISPPRKKHILSPSRKMTKTLDGKTAGLQNAKQLAAETSVLKEKEIEMFNKMSTDISGANAATVIRDKKTGRIRNLEEEAAREFEKKKKEEVNKVKYSRWGKGLKQVEDATKKREEELNEMSKPLARYANDEDLERYLKEQEREGDPMLAFIRKKKKKKDVEEGKPIKPEYMGEFMPNRFGIRPGHRWDGVDRSNGYEKKWFDIQNSRLAQQEEAYKWSTEDM